jgi:hypothetical protein
VQGSRAQPPREQKHGMETRRPFVTASSPTCVRGHLRKALIHLALGIWVVIKRTVALLAIGILVLHLFWPANVCRCTSGDREGRAVGVSGVWDRWLVINSQLPIGCNLHF